MRCSEKVIKGTKLYWEFLSQWGASHLVTKAKYQGPGAEPRKIFGFWFVFGAISSHLRTLTFVAANLQIDGEVVFGYIANLVWMNKWSTPRESIGQPESPVRAPPRMEKSEVEADQVSFVIYHFNLILCPTQPDGCVPKQVSTQQDQLWAMTFFWVFYFFSTFRVCVLCCVVCVCVCFMLCVGDGDGDLMVTARLNSDGDLTVTASILWWRRRRRRLNEDFTATATSTFRWQWRRLNGGGDLTATATATILWWQ